MDIVTNGLVDIINDLQIKIKDLEQENKKLATTNAKYFNKYGELKYVRIEGNGNCKVKRSEAQQQAWKRALEIRARNQQDRKNNNDKIIEPMTKIKTKSEFENENYITNIETTS